jgi:ABC-2 type transport system ATP-binding protein
MSGSVPRQESTPPAADSVPATVSPFPDRFTGASLFDPTSVAEPAVHIAVKVDNLVKRFGSHTAVDGVSFEVPSGTVLGLLGPNGAGKTTIVNMLATLQRPDSGTATVAGYDVRKQRALVRRSIMLTGQFAALDEALTGRENLILFGRLMGLSKAAARIRADELLRAFDITDAAARRVGKYSGGMRRRIDIACGLVVRPEVVFLDEPTTGLDPRSRQEVWNIVAALRDHGITTLLTTQYLEEADLLSDKIVVIDHGRVIAHGTASELKERVSGTFCEVVPSFPGDIPRVRALLLEMIPADHVRTSPSGASVTVPAIDGAATLTEIVKRTSEAGIALLDVGLRRPSLDDVFLKLTGGTDSSRTAT